MKTEIRADTSTRYRETVVSSPPIPLPILHPGQWHLSRVPCYPEIILAARVNDRASARLQQVLPRNNDPLVHALQDRPPPPTKQRSTKFAARSSTLPRPGFQHTPPPDRMSGALLRISYLLLLASAGDTLKQREATHDLSTYH